MKNTTEPRKWCNCHNGHALSCPWPYQPTLIRATFLNPDGTIHSYTFDMNDDTMRVRFAIECKRAYARKGAKITTEAL